MSALGNQLGEATRLIRQREPKRADISVGVVLGSGLGGFAERLSNRGQIPYADIPHFHASTVSGHAGQLVLGTIGGVACGVLQGRVHYYEGHSAAKVVFPVRALIALGAKVIILTNAAGGIQFPAGTLMLIRDHIHMLPDHPLRGDNDDSVGPRFPDMTTAYDPRLRELAKAAGRRVGTDLAEGVYLSSPGPSYETPAEIRMARVLGADAIGMLTTPETIAAVHMGAKVIGISCISNAAAGMTGEALTHEEVKETAARVAPQFEALLSAIVTDLGQIDQVKERL